MRELHWDWEQLQNCPMDVFEDIIRFMNTEAKFRQSEAKRHGTK